MGIFEPLLKNGDIISGLLVSLAAALVCFTSGLNTLGLGALVAAFVYAVKLYGREKGL
jgi:hypothetical protein